MTTSTPTEVVPDFVRIEDAGTFPRVRLVEPTTSGYLLVAAEIDRRPMFLPGSGRKRRLVELARVVAAELRDDPSVVQANAFVGILAPPGRGEILRDRPEVQPARYDLAVLIEATSPEIARTLEVDDRWSRLVDILDRESNRTYRLRATNVRHMGPVDHRRNGVFLFNYFFAERTDLNLAAWQYTAGWFMDQTGLDNSTVLLPEASSDPSYRLINHARWDRLGDILPSLIFKRSFRRYVLEHFARNGVAAMPILYRMA